MEITTNTYYGWHNAYRTVEKRINFDYARGNDVTVVEHREYLVLSLYNEKGATQADRTKGTNIDQMV